LLASLLPPLTCHAADAQSWVSVWNDEFDGPTIDLSKWEHEVNDDGGGNEELQYYTARTQNSRIENGNLVIEARKEAFLTRRYTSARLRTLGQGDWLYGRFEIRARMPSGQGLWPAIWMLPTDWVYGGWAASGEIDIMEYRGQELDRVLGTLHYGGPWPRNTFSGDSFTLPAGGDFSRDFHVFALEWEPGEIRWYVDGQHYLTQTEWFSEAADHSAPFDRRFHMILNVAVGGMFVGSPDETTVFPQRMEVDYVRVFERSSAPALLPGDFDSNGSLDINDPLALLRRLFVPPVEPLPCDSATLNSGSNLEFFDVIGDRRVNLGDPLALLWNMFVTGPPHALGESCTTVEGCPGMCVDTAEFELTDIPGCGSTDDLTGVVSGIDPARAFVTAYVQVCGQWWGPKPSAGSPLTSLQPDGSWSLDYTTGGVDEFASRIEVYLLPPGVTPPTVLGEASAPTISQALLTRTVTRGCTCP
jgi:beta-glucanase (GH16 family)